MIGSLLLFFMLTAGWVITPYQIQGGPTLCAFKLLTHLDCPGCGLTRSFLSMARGHVTEAFTYNWAGPLLYGGALLLLFRPLFIYFHFPSPKPIFLKLYSYTLFFLLFSHWVIRLQPYFLAFRG